jgi:hypothetical protein
LSAFSLEPPSQLTQIESEVFSSTSLQSIVIPCNIQFIDSTAFGSASSLNPLQITLDDCDFCPEFDRWRRLRRTGISLDFRRILKVSCDLHNFKDYFVDLSVFEEESTLNKSDFRRYDDGISIFVKSIQDLKIETLINLHHPCIVAPIGFLIPIDPSTSRELKIVRLFSQNGSLAEVLSNAPIWWTPTAKAKAVVGIVLGLRFAHSFGLLHNNLKSNNILFDVDHRIQITDFGSNEQQFSFGLTGDDWTPKADVRGFASLLFEITVGRSMNDDPAIPSDIPAFVSEIIKAGRSRDSPPKRSFRDIFETLRRNDFQIMEGVNSTEVSSFVSWVESSE